MSAEGNITLQSDYQAPLLCISVVVCTQTDCLLQVRYLKVIEKSGYQALPWVRYITTGGEYEIRMA